MHQAIRRQSAAERLGHLLLRPSVPSWLISLVVHLVLLVIFALTFSRTNAPRGVVLGLTVSEASSQGEGQEVGMAPEPAGGKTVEGEPSAAARTISTLAAALDNGPPSDPTAVLPASLGTLGGDALEGGGAGSAAALGTGNGPGAGTGRGLGGKARTSIFGAEGEGYKFVYVFDRSASMGGSGRNALEAAKVELLASLKTLQRTHQFQIVFYNETPTVFNPTGDAHRLLFATEQNKAAAERFVASISAYDGTRHEDALMMAIRLQPDVIFFLTDADEPRLGPNQLARLHRAAAGIAINTIEFGFGPQADPDNFLVQLARENEGRHVYVDISKVLSARAK